MIRFLRFSIFFLIWLLFSPKSFAQFPYIESFRYGAAPGISFGGAPSAFLTAAGSGFDGTNHVGTPIDPNGNGYLRLTSNANDQKGYAISTANFPSSNGLSVLFEYYIYGGNGADGISFFLFDAKASPFNIGGFGGSLGYAQFTNTTPTSYGVSGGYLAIGLDEYGNFSNPIEGRQGGIPGLRPGSVTLRGKGNGDALTPDNYKFLTTAKMIDYGFDLVGDASARRPDSTNIGYRRVYMDMAPNANGGYNITVRVTRGGTPTTTATVISNFYYPEAAPQNLRYGFASSTGFQTNFHEIRNVAIDAYDVNGLTNPTAANDLLTLCQGKQAIIDVSLNDKTTNPGASLVKASIDLDPNTPGLQNTFTIAGKGTFSLNSDNNVQFVPESAFIGTVSCFYNIKDTFGRTSNSAAVTLTYAAAPPQPDAGPSQLLNITTPFGAYQLQGSSTGLNIGKWTQVSGPNTATITNPALYNTNISNLAGGVYIFRWTVTSAGGCDLSSDVKITINHRPVANDDFMTTNLNTDIAIPILDNDTDADGNSTIDRGSISIKNQPQHGILIIDPVTGIVTYRPYAGYSGFDSFVYTIKDNFGAESNTAIVTIAVNIKPTGIDDLTNTITNIPVSIHVVDNDPGKNGVTVIKNTDPINGGTIIVNPDGTITYTPKDGFSGRDTFTYKIKNKDGLESDPITVTVNVKPSGKPDFANTLATNPVIIPVKDNDDAKTGTSVVVVTPPTNGTVVINPSGTITYTPKNDFSGIETYTYKLVTADGLESDPIVVTVTVKPVGTADNVTTPFNTAIAIAVKTNDISKAGTTVVLKSNPAHGTITSDSQGNMVYTPTPGYSGTDTYNYILRTADGIESDLIPVTITIKPAVIINTPNINIVVTSGDKKTVDVAIPPGGTITIVTPPTHGTITYDPITGLPIYTPNPGYTGPDTFTYTLKDKDGNPSATTGTVNITVTPAPIPAKIGLAKNLSKTVKNIDGSFDLTFTFTMVNIGEIDAKNLSLTDDLSTTFLGATVVIKKITSLGTLIVNNSYNGTSDKQLLSNNNILKAQSKEQIEILANIILGEQTGVFKNSAFLEGVSAKTGELLTDQSTDGFNPDRYVTGDFSPKEPTIITLNKGEIFIPGGFSPNNDGINDFFVIENAQGKQIALEVYNRWGNRIHKATKYENNWAGKTTEGIHIGDDVPAGTYYYIITIDNKDKRVGYITINR